MINRKDVLSMSFYKLSPFMGSDGNMRFRIEKAEEQVETGETGEDGQPVTKTEKYLKTTIWPGPFCYTATDPSLYIVHRGEFSEEGICEAVEWLNAEHKVFE